MAIEVTAGRTRWRKGIGVAFPSVDKYILPHRSFAYQQLNTLSEICDMLSVVTVC